MTLRSCDIQNSTLTIKNLKNGRSGRGVDVPRKALVRLTDYVNINVIGGVLRLFVSSKGGKYSPPFIPTVEIFSSEDEKKFRSLMWQYYAGGMKNQKGELIAVRVPAR